MWLFVLFVAVPLIEIGLFIKVGGWLTLWPTLAIVMATGILGSYVLRQQGRQVLAELRRSTQGLDDPLSPLAHGALIVLAGVLLLTPGFFTDAVGLALLIPALRRAVIATVARRVRFEHVTFGNGRTQSRPEGVIDGEFIDLDTDVPKKPGASGWTRH